MASDLYGYELTTSNAAAVAYDRGLRDVLRLTGGAVAHIAESIAHDPTFALGHATLALLGHEICAPVDIAARLRAAELHAGRATERERSHVHAVAAHIRGDSRPLVAHLAAYPLDALLLSTAVPTIAFAGATEVPEQAWAIVERCAPAYGGDWWFTGLLAFVRQEQGRFDDAMDLACRSLAEEPGAGHSAHARAHAHYETGDHAAGLAWMDRWVRGDGADVDSLSHFSWHAALHELSLGDLDAVRARYLDQLQPGTARGCRALVDSGSLLFRWALTPGAESVPTMGEVVSITGRATLEGPATPFLAMHAAIAHLAVGDVTALRRLSCWAASQAHPVQRDVVARLAAALALMAAGHCSEAATELGRLSPRRTSTGRVRCAAGDRRGGPDRGAPACGPVARGAGAARRPAGPAPLAARRRLAAAGDTDRRRRLSRVRAGVLLGGAATIGPGGYGGAMSEPGQHLVVPAGPGLPSGATIPAAELVERFSRSPGPGGQSVNTTDTRVELLFAPGTSTAFTDAQRARLLANLGEAMTHGHLSVVACEHRSQLRNRVAARERLVALLREALAPPPPPRRATKPSRASQRRRVEAKKQLGRTKALRGRVRGE